MSSESSSTSSIEQHPGYVFVTPSEADWYDIEMCCRELLPDTVLYYEDRGFISYVVQDDATLVINKLFVRKDARNRGVGRALLAMLPPAKLTAVAYNRDSRAFYVACGFTDDRDAVGAWLVKVN